MKNQWNNKKFEGHPYQASSFGAAIVEVELNANTFQEKIKGIWVAIDCGEIYSIKAAESSVKLAIQQELERLVQDTIVPCENIRISFLASSFVLFSNILSSSVFQLCWLCPMMPSSSADCSSSDSYSARLPSPESIRERKTCRHSRN